MDFVGFFDILSVSRDIDVQRWFSHIFELVPLDRIWGPLGEFQNIVEESASHNV